MSSRHGPAATFNPEFGAMYELVYDEETDGYKREPTMLNRTLRLLLPLIVVLLFIGLVLNIFHSVLFVSQTAVP